MICTFFLQKNTTKQIVNEVYEKTQPCLKYSVVLHAKSHLLIVTH